MIKIDIVSGFLGAGKTTLIKKLLKEALHSAKVVLIENEFGEIGIDGGFLKDAGIEIKEMNSGCICCSLVGDFGTALKEVMETYSPDRILIEPSGVGKLSDVKRAVQNVTGIPSILQNVEKEKEAVPNSAKNEQKAVLNSAAAVVDASKCRIYIKNFGEFFIDQISQAETIILSRTDKISEQKLTECVELLRRYNKEAVIITTPWDRLDGRLILDTIEKTQDLGQTVKKMIKELHEEHNHEHHAHSYNENDDVYSQSVHDANSTVDHEHHAHSPNKNDASGTIDHEHDENGTCGCHHHDHHHADEVFMDLGIETPIAYEKEEIEAILEQLEDESLYGMVLRAKGMVASADGDWLYFDYVPGESNVRGGRADVIGKICVIGVRLREENLKTLWKKEELFHI